MSSKKKQKSSQKTGPKIADLSEDIKAVDVIIPLKNVLFVGGQENFINKMKKLYPEWTYLDTDERNSGKIKGEYELAIIKANHCSHNIIERALSRCKDVPIIYSNATNVKRALEEIKSGLQKEWNYQHSA